MSRKRRKQEKKAKGPHKNKYAQFSKAEKEMVRYEAQPPTQILIRPTIPVVTKPVTTIYGIRSTRRSPLEGLYGNSSEGEDSYQKRLQELEERGRRLFGF